MARGGYLPDSHRGCSGSILRHSVGLCGGQIGIGTDFSQSTSVFPCQCNSTNTRYSSSATSFSYQTYKRAKPGNLPKGNVLSEIGTKRIEKWKVKEACNRPDVAQRFPGDLGSQISWYSAREGGEVVSLTHRPLLPPRNVPGTHFH
jgi:hypothetical protein